MSFDDDELECDEFETVTMTDDETGEEIEFSIIDNLIDGGNRYLLVVESDLIDDNETDAIILKEISTDGDDVTYALVEDDMEFDKIADLFQQESKDYDVQIDY